MAKEKKVLYTVRCVFDPKHEFEKSFTIEEGTEEKNESKVDAFCPYCDKRVRVTVKGKLVLNETIWRQFEE